MVVFGFLGFLKNVLDAGGVTRKTKGAIATVGFSNTIESFEIAHEPGVKLDLYLRHHTEKSYFLVVIFSWSFFDETNSFLSSTDAASACAVQDSSKRALNFILAGCC